MTFQFLYELLAGQHEALPPRQHTEMPTYDRAQDTFVAVDPPARESGWLGRGELPGRSLAPAAVAPVEDGSIADEMRQLMRVQDPTTPATQTTRPTT